MSDDSPFRPTFAVFTSGKGKTANENEGGPDTERRVTARRDMEASPLHIVPTDIDAAQADDLEPRIRELPLDPETVALRGQLALLRQEHKDLDDSIQALEIVPVPDQILIMRMKRKKLALRDRIATLEDKIRPDIIA